MPQHEIKILLFLWILFLHEGYLSNKERSCSLYLQCLKRVSLKVEKIKQKLKKRPPKLK